MNPPDRPEFVTRLTAYIQALPTPRPGASGLRIPRKISHIPAEFSAIRSSPKENWPINP